MSNSIAFFIIAWVSYLATGQYIQFATRQGVMDTPNARSCHQVATPRAGGIAFILTWMFSLLIGYQAGVVTAELIVLFIPSLWLITATGWREDRKGLSKKMRLLAQLTTAAGFVYTLNIFYPLPTWLRWLSVPGIVWSINLFNFMDGLDGYATTEAMALLLLHAAFCWQQDHIAMVYASLSLVAALAGFWIWNKPAAKVFMGDTGSTFLGFMLAAMALCSMCIQGVHPLVWGIAYGLFWVDATLTLLWRMSTGQAWTQPHRLHAYQRLYAMGWSHQRILAWGSVLNLGLLSLAWYAHANPTATGGALVLALGVLASVYGIIFRVSRPHMPPIPPKATPT